MARLMYCIAATGVVRDAETNTLSLYNLLEQITPTAFPAFLSEVKVLAVWARENQEPDFELQFEVWHNQERIMSEPVPVSFQELQRTRTIVGLTGIPIPAPGVLSFRFLLNGQITASCDVEVLAPPVGFLAGVRQVAMAQPRPAGAGV